MNYHDKKFRPLTSSENSETTEDTVFHYEQSGNVLTSNYSGGNVIKGHLIGVVEAEGTINMRYHQVNAKEYLMTGVCQSKPEIMKDGKIRLHESWQWTSGDNSTGKSIIEEIA